MTGGVQNSAGVTDIPPPNLLGSTRKSPPAPRSDAEGAPASVPCHSSSAAKVINRGEGDDRGPNGPRPYSDENWYRAFSSPSLPMRVGVWQLFGSEKWGAGMLMSERGFFLVTQTSFALVKGGGVVLVELGVC